VDENLAFRAAAIRHCRLLSLRWGEAVPYEELKNGFPYRHGRVKLVGPQGVFKPKDLTDGPLTLLSTLASTYQDEHLDGDHVLYDYAPPHREFENDGLKAIAAKGRQVILFKQVKTMPLVRSASASRPPAKRWQGSLPRALESSRRRTPTPTPGLACIKHTFGATSWPPTGADAASVSCASDPFSTQLTSCPTGCPKACRS